MLLEDFYAVRKPNASEKVLLYILKHTNEDYLFCETYNTIQKETGVSQPTIAKVFKAMEEVGAAKKIGQTKWDMHGLVERFVKKMDPYKVYVKSEVVYVD